MSTRRDVTLLGCLALLVAGCSSTHDGEAVPLPAAGSSTQPSEQRPSELSLDGVDPCSLFTDAQLDKLKVNSKPRSSEEGRDGPTCSLDVDLTAPYYSYYVEAVPADLREWTDGKRAKDIMATEQTEVEGYPALISHAESSSPSDCETLVGVAEGQTLRTQLYPTDPSEFTQAQMCDMAKRAATLAVQTLQSTR